MNRLKAAGSACAVFLGVCSLWLPEVADRPTKPQCDPYGPVLVSTDSGETAAKKSKPCNPACKAPEVCYDGTCCLPACFPPSYSPPTLEAHFREPHSAVAETWTADTIGVQ